MRTEFLEWDMYLIWVRVVPLDDCGFIPIRRKVCFPYESPLITYLGGVCDHMCLDICQLVLQQLFTKVGWLPGRMSRFVKVQAPLKKLTWYERFFSCVRFKILHFQEKLLAQNLTKSPPAPWNIGRYNAWAGGSRVQKPCQKVWQRNAVAMLLAKFGCSAELSHPFPRNPIF